MILEKLSGDDKFKIISEFFKLMPINSELKISLEEAIEIILSELNDELLMTISNNQIDQIYFNDKNIYKNIESIKNKII